MIGQVGHYEVLEKLGGGGMGVVYRARDTRLGRDVAIKFLPDSIDSDEALERFEREARAASALAHPKICVVHDLGRHEGRPYVVMELLKGETLRSVVNRGGLDLEEVLEIAIDLCEGLEAAHEAGILHRDLKPANLFRTDKRHVKILDFGLAKQYSAPVSGDASDSVSPTFRLDAELTAAGTMLGTLGYMSPEQALGRRLGASSDLFSLAAVIYELASGQRAFQGETTGALLDSLLHHQPPPLEGGELARELDSILHKALAKEPDERHQSARELRQELQLLRGDSRSSSLVGVKSEIAESASSKSSRKRAWLLAAIVGLAGLISWGIWNANRSPVDEATVASDESPEVADSAPRLSVAVLPLLNLSGQGDLEHLNLALANEVITELSYVQGLSVRPFTMTMSYGSGSDLERAIEELEVTQIVTGHYQLVGDDMLQVTLEAITTEERDLTWRDSISVPLQDVVALGTRLGERVRNGLVVELGGEGRGEGIDSPRSPEAYDLYLRSLAISSNPKPNRDAIRMLEESIEMDDGFAKTWEQLAQRLYYHAMDTPGVEESAYARAVAAASRSLELDPDLTRARNLLIIMEVESGHLLEAWKAAQVWIERRPDQAMSHFTMSYVLRYAGLGEESRRHCDVAYAIDPRESQLRSCYATFLQGRQWERALDFVRLDSESSWGAISLTAIEMRRGDREAAMRAWGRVDPNHPAYLARNYCLEDLTPEQRERTDAMTRRIMGIRDPEPATTIAGKAIGCGHEALGLDMLESAVERGYCAVEVLEDDPLLESVRGSERWQLIRDEALACREAFVEARRQLEQGSTS